MVAYKDFTEFTHCIYDLKTTHNPNEWAVCCANGLYFLNIQKQVQASFFSIFQSPFQFSSPFECYCKGKPVKGFCEVENNKIVIAQEYESYIQIFDRTTQKEIQKIEIPGKSGELWSLKSLKTKEGKVYVFLKDKFHIHYVDIS